MKPEKKAELLKAVNHNFGLYELEDYSEEERESYRNAKENLEGYQENASNEALANEKIESLEARHQEINNIISTNENMMNYFEEHYLDLDEWKDHHFEVASLNEMITLKEENGVKLNSVLNEAKAKYDEALNKPFEISMLDPDFEKIRMWDRHLKEDEEKLQREKDDVEKYTKSAEEGKKKLELLSKTIDPETLKHDIEEFEGDEDYIDEVDGNRKEYLKTLKQMNKDIEERDYWIEAQPGLIDSMKDNQKSFDKMMKAAKDRAYKAEKDAYDEALKNKNDNDKEIENLKITKTNLDRTTRSLVNRTLTHERALNYKMSDDLKEFIKIEKTLSGKPVLSEEKILNSAAKVKEAYNLYYTSHSSIGRFFKFLPWTSAAHDYKDYKDIRGAFTGAVGNKVNEKDLNEYIEGTKEALPVQDLIADEQVNVNEARREQVEINVEEPEKENNQVKMEDNPVVENDLEKRA